MTRKKLESYLYKKVKITLFDNDVIEGTLMKGRGIGNGYVDYPPSWYRIPEKNFNLRCSHVKKVEVL